MIVYLLIESVLVVIPDSNKPHEYSKVFYLFLQIRRLINEELTEIEHLS